MTNPVDPLFDKTWSLQPDLSRFSALVAPDSETRVYENLDNGYKLTVSGTREGQTYEWGYTAYYDGDPHPVHGREDVDSIRIFKLDARRTVGLFDQGGSPGGPYARVVSEDGSQLTVEAAGRNADGSAFYDVIAYNTGN
jgi:hypothetical protein